MFTVADLSRFRDDLGYRESRDIGRLQSITDREFIVSKFILHDQADVVNSFAPQDVHLVTGFGPTNAPTGGSVSIMLRAISLCRGMNVRGTLIVSDLGAWCSRRTTGADLQRTTERFLAFLDQLGVHESGISVRTHQNIDVLRIAGLITRYLDEDLLTDNEEATAALYGQLNLLGNRFGVWTDMGYTVADILEPLLLRGAKCVLVLAGLEEHYFVRLARAVLERMAGDPDCPIQIPDAAAIGGLYARVIDGFAPYPKMSKSIPDSGISLGESAESLRTKVTAGPPEHDLVLMQLMEMCSLWSDSELASARAAFESRQVRAREWVAAREQYLEFFLELQKAWVQAQLLPAVSDSIFTRTPASLG